MLQSNLYIPYIYELYSTWSWRADNEITMARIDDYILDCVIYLYPTKEAAKNSENAGGSGFIACIQSKTVPTTFYTYAVTNKHIIDENNKVIRVNKQDGSIDIIDNLNWIPHPNGDEVAVASLSIDQNIHKLNFMVSDILFATKDKIKELDIDIGDEVYIAGRFQGMDGKIQNTPTIRIGNIAQMPIEPHRHESGILLESYLVECHSISGFSGSPVFVYIPPLTMRPNSSIMNLVWHRLFLGIDWGHKRIRENIERYNNTNNKWEKEAELKVLSNSAMMSVVPAWKLKELLDQDEFMKVREEFDKKFEKEKKPIADEEITKSDSISLTEEDFKNSLKKVSMKITPSEPDPSKPKT